jgi:Flp pilus assembly protein TadG
VKKFRARENDERGAELVEFAFVVVLLITLIYGVLVYGLVLAVQTSITQSAADGNRAGIVVASTLTGSQLQTTVYTQVQNDLGWLTSGLSSAKKQCNGGGPITCTLSGPQNCPSNVTSNIANQCLELQVSYDYKDYALIPSTFIPTPSTISSTSWLVVSSPSS